ncbi:zinc finger protein ubi-d4 isoform X4 [Homalodisca vitripennis]|uniref:zinc finger protein ubi-d4 isoform X4 n=1 Tax=Homalodisca vitripennis TaxID=197043 RepID=UPI001EE9DD1D|nr:zinc finger protein ubi-d4 isoform X4 [Homalodisca vitripennis]
MASFEIQIGNPSVLSRIESFMNDSAYREAIENSANYNTRLCIERRMRMPFLDPQTGIAQNHSHLYLSARERLPGLLDGQVYSYPAKRWRKRRRQYLMQMPNRRKDQDLENNELHTISTVENPAVANSEDSKDSSGLKEESTTKVPDTWFYDELDLQAMDGFDEPDPDSDYDYEETYTKRRKRRGPGSKQSKPSENTTKKSKAGSTPGRGRKKGMQYAADPNDTDKPFSCDRATPVKKQTRSNAPIPPVAGPSMVPVSVEESHPPVRPPSPVVEKKIVIPEPLPPMPVLAMEQANKEKATPNPYCDFCLGDAVINKKSGQPEELVSCSDCGRSGHPTCLQFTANMIVSVCKYRWQCIECKCCSICGTSDNDDQLLFCDDCDRGYHMYCLAPPLTQPPEGSWSCRLCLSEFHQK